MLSICYWTLKKTFVFVWYIVLRSFSLKYEIYIFLGWWICSAELRFLSYKGSHLRVYKRRLNVWLTPKIRVIFTRSLEISTSAYKILYKKKVFSTRRVSPLQASINKSHATGDLNPYRLIKKISLFSCPDPLFYNVVSLTNIKQSTFRK